MAGFLKGVLTFIFAFFLGASYAQDKEPTDSELQQKVQDHMDVIVDESAALVDDVLEEVNKNEDVQKASEFVDDVTEIIDNTTNDIREHFGPEETEEVSEVEVETETEKVEGSL